MCLRKAHGGRKRGLQPPLALKGPIQELKELKLTFWKQRRATPQEVDDGSISDSTCLDIATPHEGDHGTNQAEVPNNGTYKPLGLKLMIQGTCIYG